MPGITFYDKRFKKDLSSEEQQQVEAYLKAQRYRALGKVILTPCLQWESGPQAQLFRGLLCQLTDDDL